MGHLHLNVRDMEAQKKFWIDVMGAAPARLGPIEGMKLPNVLILFDKGTPAGGTRGAVVDHIGFRFRDLRGSEAKMKAAGARFVTVEETRLGKPDRDVWFNPGSKIWQAFLMAPDDIKIELVEDASIAAPVVYYHAHFFDNAAPETEAWYVKTFGAKLIDHVSYTSADVPGVTMIFTPDPSARAGTKGRSLDHIGFEVRNLEEFCKKLEGSGLKFDVSYRKIPSLNISIAFLTDPWGTYIELTEGLDRI